jgi:hypothetical protein
VTTVYALFFTNIYEPDHLVGIFSSEEKAWKYCDDFCANSREYPRRRFDVRDYQLDKEDYS